MIDHAGNPPESASGSFRISAISVMGTTKKNIESVEKLADYTVCASRMPVGVVFVRI